MIQEIIPVRKNKSWKLLDNISITSLLSFNMAEKHDQTTAMLNDENHPPRLRTEGDQAPSRKVIFQIYYFNKYVCSFYISVVQVFVVLFVIIYFSR